MTARGRQMLLLAVKFYDQLLLDVFRNTFTLWISDESSFELCFVPIQPAEFRVLTTYHAGDRSALAAAFFDGDYITGFQLVGRNVHYLAVYFNVFVGLTS